MHFSVRSTIVLVRSRPMLNVAHRQLHLSPMLGHEMGDIQPDLLLSSTKNNVTTLTMNDPKKLNGWTGPMMVTMQHMFKQLAKDDETKVMVVTGADPYYCAGVNLSATMKPMHPKKLHDMIVTNNQAVFDAFLDFPKPILIAANGPAIGACVTSASLCDGIIASEKATFNVPFATLGIPPEGCSSIHFERMLGKEAAKKMLDDGWKPTAAEAKEVGLVVDVVPHDQLMEKAQALAEQWVAQGKKKTIPGGGDVAEYKAVNAQESVALADAFLSVPFLEAQSKFLKSKGKTQMASAFWLVKALRPLWSKLL